MKKITLLASLLMFVAMSYAVNVIPVGDAVKASRNFLTERVGATKANQMEIVLVNTEYSAEGIPVTYRFKVGDNGFMIVSATDLANPVLAFSLESNYQGVTGAKLYNEQYKKELSGLISNPEGALKVRNSWNHYLAADFKPHSAKGAPSVEPLVTTRWTQEKYYNTMCPYNPQNSYADDYHTPVGCVALTMTNILFYYRYPESGYGIVSYMPKEYDDETYELIYTYPVQTVDYSTAFYNYDAIGNDLKVYDGYDGELAKMLYHSGVATRMGYGWDGSGTQSQYAMQALIDHFFYNSKAQFQSIGDVITHDTMMYQWEAIAKAELDAHRPLFFSGRNKDAGGHAWIVDGYTTIGNATYFHVNWGWAGQDNGYYLINNQNTSSSGNFNYITENGERTNTMMTGLMPDSAAIVKPSESFRRVTASYGTISDGAGNMKYAQGSNRQWVIACPDATSYTLKFDKLKVKSTDKVTIYKGGTTASGIVDNYNGDCLMAACKEYYPASGGEQGDFVGEPLPAAVTVNADSVLVVFTSAPNSETDYGFVLSYEVNSFSKEGCKNAQVTDQTAVLTDKGVNIGIGSDEEYRAANVCEYDLRLQFSNRLVYDFQKFDLKQGDFVDIYYYKSLQSRELIAHYDMDHLPSGPVSFDAPLLTLTGQPTGRFLVRFASDNKDQGTGFEMTYFGIQTGIDNNKNFTVSVYPNPAVSNLNVEITSDDAQEIKAEIVDLTGRTIYVENIGHNGGSNVYSIPVSGFAKGVYFLHLNTNNGNNIQKFVVE